MKPKRGPPYSQDGPLTKRLVVRVSQRMLKALARRAGKRQIGAIVRAAISRVLSEND